MSAPGHQPKFNTVSILKKALVLTLGLVFALLILELLSRKLSPLPYLDYQSATVFLPSDPRVFALKPNFSGRFTGVNIKTNSLGFRDEELLPKDTGKRILSLGDSVLFGYRIGESKDVSSLLERSLNARGNNIAVVNTGVPGYGLPHEIETYKKFHSELSPDMVLVNFVLNDIKKGDVLAITRNSMEDTLKRKNALRDWTNWVGGHSRLWSVVLSYSPNLLFQIGYSKPFSPASAGDIEKDQMALIHKNVETDNNYRAKLDEAWAQIDKQVGYLKELTDEDKVPLIFVIYSWREQISKNCWSSYQNDLMWQKVPLDDYALSATPQARLKEILARENIASIDLLDNFREEDAKHADCPLMFDRNHPTELGHEIAAKAIANFLIGNKLIN